MADYQAQIDALETAMGTGELKVKIDGQEVEYASARDLMARLNYLKNRQADASQSSPTRLASFDMDR